jgi:hypothetical protein
MWIAHTLYVREVRRLLPARLCNLFAAARAVAPELMLDCTMTARDGSLRRRRLTEGGLTSELEAFWAQHEAIRVVVRARRSGALRSFVGPAFELSMDRSASAIDSDLLFAVTPSDRGFFGCSYHMSAVTPDVTPHLALMRQFGEYLDAGVGLTLWNADAGQLAVDSALAHLADSTGAVSQESEERIDAWFIANQTSDRFIGRRARGAGWLTWLGPDLATRLDESALVESPDFRGRVHRCGASLLIEAAEAAPWQDPVAVEAGRTVVARWLAPIDAAVSELPPQRVSR